MTDLEFINDIFSKVSKKNTSFYFFNMLVCIGFKYETDITRAYDVLKNDYVCIRYGMTLRVSYNEKVQ